MKNLFIIPTDKPSRFTFRKDCKYYRFRKDEFVNNNTYQNQNIYITNLEEIKDGDWVYHKILKSVFKIDLREVTQEYIDEKINILKIIITTDQDLIKDGVQSIDDTFLEWFVENSSCEYIEVIKEYKDGYGNWYKYQDDFTFTVSPLIRHQIIILKEEPNPSKDIVINDKVTIEVPFHEKHIRFENLTPEQAGYLIQVSEFYQMNGVRRSALVPKEELINCPKCRTTDFKNCHSMNCPMRKEELNLNCFDCNKSLQDCTCMEDTINMNKKETLEEVAKTFVKNRFTKQICGDEFYPDIYASKEAIVESHILFTKWQQERMYSEKEVESLLHKFMQHRHPDWHGWSTTKWFEQNKKK